MKNNSDFQEEPKAHEPERPTSERPAGSEKGASVSPPVSSERADPAFRKAPQSFLRRRGKLLGCALAFLLVIAGFGFAAVRVAGKLRSTSRKAPEFATVKRGNIRRAVTETGTIAALTQVEVKSKVAGRISELLVDEGDKVQDGQLLARIDPTEVQRQANQAAAEVAAARARLAGAEWSARQQRETTRTGIAQAEARVTSAEANLRRLEAGSRPEEIARAEAGVARAAAEAEEARAALARTLEAQKAGYTTREDAEAALAAAKADLQRVEAGARPEEIARARAGVAQAKAAADDAARTLTRKQDLLRKGFVARGEVDAAETASSSTAAALDEARQALALLEAGARKEEIAVARARLRQAEIALKSAASTSDQAVTAAQARRDVAEAAVKSAREDLALSRAGARREDIDAARAQVAEAHAALQAARAATSRDAAALAEVDAARAAVTSAAERLEAARVQLGDTSLVAPISGTIVTRHIQAGELVASGTTGLSAGIAVVTLADLSTLIVRVRLNEVDVAQVRPGRPAEVRVDAYPGVVFPGHVRRIAPAAGQGQSQRQQGGDTQIVRFDVEVELEKPDPRLRTGMTASVDIDLERADNVLYVVREALARDDKKWTAMVLTDPEKIRKMAGPDRAKLTEAEIQTKKTDVKVGIQDDVRVEVRGGLKEKDLILITDEGRAKRRTFEFRN